MVRCALLLLALAVISAIEANPAPVAQPDPRDYVLVPLEEFVAENEDLAPRFRSAAEQPRKFRSSFWEQMGRDSFGNTCGAFPRKYGNTQETGIPCVFPFMYEGKEYNVCTTAGNGGGRTKWCPTQTNAFGYGYGSFYGNKWGYCFCADRHGNPA